MYNSYFSYVQVQCSLFVTLSCRSPRKVTPVNICKMKIKLISILFFFCLEVLRENVMAYRQGVRKKAFGIRVRDVTVYKISSSFKIDCVSESLKPNAVYTPISSTAVLV